jgi:hypothetical protein
MISEVEYWIACGIGGLSALGVLALLVFAVYFYIVDCFPHKKKINPNIPRSSL